MSNQKELTSDLEAITSIKTITSIYQEIASFRMNQLRGQVAKTREFLDGVAAVYNHTKTAYLASLQNVPFDNRKKKMIDTGFLRKNGKRVEVLLSANEHLYGTLILDIWGHYLNEINNQKCDGLVVGSFGKYLANNEKISGELIYFDLDDYQPEAAQIKKIVDVISKYEKVVVHHGQMISVITQEPVQSEISGGISYGQKIQKGTKRYLFEPSPEKILEFFETEVIGALFNQTVLEHELARFAARMIAMDEATENPNEEIKKINRQLSNLIKRVLKSKQLQVYAGFSLWKKEEKWF